MQKIELKPHQQEIIDMNPERALIPDGTGSGKTIIGIMLANKNCKTCLVVTLKDNVKKWERDIHEFSTQKCGFEIMSKENFKKNHTTLPSFDGIIVDECHKFAGVKAKSASGALSMSGSLRKYLTKWDIRCRWLMSATPLTSNWLSIYVLARHLGHNINYYRFLRHFFYEIQMGGRKVWQQNPHMEGDLMDMIKKLSHGRMISLEKIVKVPKQTFITEYFELTDEQKKGIEAIDNPEHIVRFTKRDQIESGTLKGNEYESSKNFPCLKNDRILELVKQNDRIAIFCRYTCQIEFLRGLLGHLNRPIFIIDGHNKDRDTTIQEIGRSQHCIVILNTDSATGFELPSISTIIYASFSFSFIMLTQSQGRFLRVNALHENTYYYLVTQGGTSEAIYNCLMKKADFYIDLYKGFR